MLLGIHSFAYHVPHAENVKSSIGQNGEVQSSCAALRLFRSWRGGKLSCHRYLVFHPFVEQLPSRLLCQL